jgi:hypothetical protein
MKAISKAISKKGTTTMASKPYPDMAMRRAELIAFEHQQSLERRRLWIRDPLECLGASFAIAGAATLSRTTLCSFDTAMALLAAGNYEIDMARLFGRWIEP